MITIICAGAAAIGIDSGYRFHDQEGHVLWKLDTEEALRTVPPFVAKLPPVPQVMIKTEYQKPK